MKIAVFMAVLLSLLAFNAVAQETYYLNAGDRVFVEVWNEPDMQREVIILPDGYLSFPLAGQVKAAGLTPQQLQSSIAERLGQYISTPVVTVSVIEMTGNSIFVIGQVNAPGSYIMNRQMTALQALSLSGGFTSFANTKSIRIIRKDANGEQVLRVNYSSLRDGNALDTNHVLVSGDVLIVP